MALGKLNVLISADQIQERIDDMGARIDADYPNHAETVHLIAILKGAYVFMADLSRKIKRPVTVDFMGISSYGKGKTSSGEVRVTKDLDTVIEGNHVIIVEDIVDSGVTLTYLLNLLDQRKPKSIKIAALLDKPERRLRPINAAYVGFSIPDKFVVGYGLDYDEKYRNLPDICVLGDDGE